MARHRLDLLPLLDVFMVVLFVFATIQEQQLGDSTRDAEQLQQQVAQAQQTLEQVQQQQHEFEQQHQHQQTQREAQRELDDVAKAETEREVERLRKELERLRESATRHEQKTREDLERMGLPADARQRIEVLTHVLDKYSVIEVDIRGRTGEGDVIVHDCCFRADPLGDRWSSCGVVPQRFEDRTVWLDSGADGLVDVLRKTKGGNAMTVVRQDQAVGHRIGSRLVEQLRERFSDQHFYVEEEVVLLDHCAQ
ncbi:MAG: hypothetical protein AAF799_24025 [Myxococcota bacterium]